MSQSGPTSAHVDLYWSNNSTFQDAFQFDPPPGLTGVSGGTGPYWNFENKRFLLEIKGNREDTLALYTLDSNLGQIVVDSTTLRVVHTNVDDATLNAVLYPGKYYFSFIMQDQSVSPVNRVELMHGDFNVKIGV